MTRLIWETNREQEVFAGESYRPLPPPSAESSTGN